MQFENWLYSLKHNYCGECSGNIITCKITKAIHNSEFSNEFFCPRCFGIAKTQIPVEVKINNVDKNGRIKTKYKTELKTIYSGGLLSVIAKDGNSTIVYRCSCKAGDMHPKIQKYDHNYWNDSRCLYQINQDYIKWLEQRVVIWQKKADIRSKELARINLIPIAQILEKYQSKEKSE